MPKKTYAAIDPNGLVHIRTTADRTYSHTVVFQWNFEHDLAEASKLWNVDESNYAFAGKMVAWGGVYGGKRESYHSDEQIKRDLDNNQAILDSAPDAKAFAEAKRLERIASVHKAKEAGAYEVWRNAGWSGRPDLAAALQRKWAHRNGKALEAVLCPSGKPADVAEALIAAGQATEDQRAAIIEQLKPAKKK